MNKLGVMIGAKDDVLENDVLMGDDSRDDTEGRRDGGRACRCIYIK